MSDVSVAKISIRFLFAQVLISHAFALFQFYLKLDIYKEIMKMWLWRDTSKRELDDIRSIYTDSSIMEFPVFLN